MAVGANMKLLGGTAARVVPSGGFMVRPPPWRMLQLAMPRAARREDTGDPPAAQDRKKCPTGGWQAGCFARLFRSWKHSVCECFRSSGALYVCMLSYMSGFSETCASWMLWLGSAFVLGQGILRISRRISACVSEPSCLAAVALSAPAVVAILLASLASQDRAPFLFNRVPTVGLALKAAFCAKPVKLPAGAHVDGCDAWPPR